MLNYFCGPFRDHRGSLQWAWFRISLTLIFLLIFLPLKWKRKNIYYSLWNFFSEVSGEVGLGLENNNVFYPCRAFPRFTQSSRVRLFEWFTCLIKISSRLFIFCGPVKLYYITCKNCIPTKAFTLYSHLKNIRLQKSYHDKNIYTLFCLKNIRLKKSYPDKNIYILFWFKNIRMQKL